MLCTILLHVYIYSIIMTGILRYILPILLLMAMEPKQIFGGDVMELVKINFFSIKDGIVLERPFSEGYYNPEHKDICPKSGSSM